MRAGARQFGVTLTPERARMLALLGIGALASFNFLWQLGSSSFFIDEVSSLNIASTPFAHLLTKLELGDDVNPAAYFAILHLWIDFAGSTSEWVARLPSAVAGVALVFTVYRLGVLVANERVGLIASLLVAVSPLILQYSQEARAYTMAMLAVSIGAIGTLEAVKRESWRWVVIGVAGFAAAFSMHYGTLAIAAPFCFWMLSRRATPLRMRLAFCGVTAIAWLAWLPFAIAQWDNHPGEQLGQYGNLTIGHIVRVVAAPFDDRYTTHPGVLKAFAAALVVGAIAVTAITAWRERREEVLLLVVVVLATLFALLAAAAVGVDILSSRYMTFAVPFLVVVVAVAISRVPRTLSLAALAGLLLTAAVFDVGSHRVRGFYPDTRGVVETIASRWRKGDVVERYTTFGVAYTLRWYFDRLLPGGRVLVAGTPAARRSLVGHPRLWIVRMDPALSGPGGRTPPVYREGRLQTFAGSADLSLALASRRR